MIRSARQFVVMLLTVALLSATVRAANVQYDYSRDETFVGVPITLTIQVTNAQNIAWPDLPEIDGATIRSLGSPAEFTAQTTINGRTTVRRSMTARYAITPTRKGDVTVPEMSMVVDGREVPIPGRRITVNESNTGDLMFAQLVTDRESYYLGESVDVSLLVMIKQYLGPVWDRGNRTSSQVETDARSMWQLVSMQRSDLGPFADKLIDRFGRPVIPPHTDIEENDSAGNPVIYHVYEVKTTIRPTQGGQINIDPVTIVVDYPVRVERDYEFGLLSRGPKITETRPIAVVASLSEKLTIAEPPEQGRPDEYNGAVGTYSIRVRAEPREVAVGDPITLTIQIRDMANEAAALDVLPPPPLDRVDELTANFRVPSEPLAGEVSGRMKTFQQTIRARRADVTEIPAIPYVYFDPETKRYETARSTPIPISVTPASTLAMRDLVVSEGSLNTAATELTEMSQGIVANYGLEDDLLSDQRLRITWISAMVAAGSPLCFVIIAMSRLRAAGRDERASRRKRAYRRAIRQLRAGASGDHARELQTAAASINGYIADRCGLKREALASGEIIRRLRSASLDEAIVRDVEAILTAAEASQYAGGAAIGSNDTLATARRSIEQMERVNLS